MKLLTLTREHFSATVNRRQCKILGVSWSPEKGWLKQLIGTQITEAKYNQYINAVFLRTKRKRAHANNTSPTLFDSNDIQMETRDSKIPGN